MFPRGGASPQDYQPLSALTLNRSSEPINRARFTTSSSDSRRCSTPSAQHYPQLSSPAIAKTHASGTERGDVGTPLVEAVQPHSARSYSDSVRYRPPRAESSLYILKPCRMTGGEPGGRAPAAPSCTLHAASVPKVWYQRTRPGTNAPLIHGRTVASKACKRGPHIVLTTRYDRGGFLPRTHALCVSEGSVRPALPDTATTYTAATTNQPSAQATRATVTMRRGTSNQACNGNSDALGV